CAGSTFIAGADISEFGKPPRGPDFNAVLNSIEAAAKPVVAAIHGTALGGGLETALVCHYRIAVPSAKLGVPEVKLGLLPGAGGTQRLPRVVGIEAAATMTSTGDPLPAAKAKELGLVDELAGEDSLAADAIVFARAKIADGPRPTRERPVFGDVAVIEQLKAANAKRWRGFEAPYANLACVEAATRLPFEEGLAFEREQFMKLMFGSQSAAQRHIFFAERQAAKIDGLPKDTQLRDIKKVGVIGAGTMGGGISMNFLQKGIPVTIVEMQQEALDRGVGVIRKNYDASAAKGRFKPEQVDQMMGILTPTLSLDDLADCDLIIEAVYENMDVKKEIFGKLDTIAKPGAILASNTSYLDVDEIATATSRPGDVLGMHFFSPANVMKLLEVVRGEKTAPDALATAMAIGKKIGKVAVVAGVCDGFIGNRMLKPRQIEAMNLLMEGATPQQIDKVHVEFGMPMGPFQMSDLAGVDIGWHRDPTRIESIRDALAAVGRWGQKTGKGFYDYDEKRNPSPSAEVAEIIEDFRSRSNKAKREISDQEIIGRTLYPMVNEGALILSEGKAQRASDIDVVWIYGYGWPVYRGGPMFWAGLEGTDKIVAALEKHGFAVA
ncbi:MAG: 3-hydroxyacyl-CoA dehydrogenase, partial [Sphingomonadales bacterium]